MLALDVIVQDVDDFINYLIQCSGSARRAPVLLKHNRSRSV